MKPEHMTTISSANQVFFRDHRDAGRQLARKLQSYADRKDLLVLALPRGGVPVAFEVALALNAPLDVCVVRRLGAPGLESVTLGAVAAGGAWILDESVIREFRISDRVLREIAEQGFRELRELELSYRGERPAAVIRGRTVILVDEGATTGHTLSQAAAALRRHDPARIIVAVPTASAAARAHASRGVDEWVALHEPDPFVSIGLAYDEFTRPSMELVRNLIRLAAGNPTRHWA